MKTLDALRILRDGALGGEPDHHQTLHVHEALAVIGAACDKDTGIGHPDKRGVREFHHAAAKAAAAMHAADRAQLEFRELLRAPNPKACGEKTAANGTRQ